MEGQVSEFRNTIAINIKIIIRSQKLQCKSVHSCLEDGEATG